MFKTSDFYDLMIWFLLSLFWIGNNKNRCELKAESPGVAKISPSKNEMNDRSELILKPAENKNGEPRFDGNWLYSEAMSLNRNKINKSNERRRKEDRREVSVEANKRAGE